MQMLVQGQQWNPVEQKGRAQQSALDKAPPVFPVQNQVPYVWLPVHLQIHCHTPDGRIKEGRLNNQLFV